jgi:hypothetical protein
LLQVFDLRFIGRMIICVSVRRGEAVEAERRLYMTGAAPYDEVETRNQVLAKNVTDIERREMGTWIKLAAAKGSVPKRSA